MFVDRISCFVAHGAGFVEVFRRTPSRRRPGSFQADGGRKASVWTDPRLRGDDDERTSDPKGERVGGLRNACAAPPAGFETCVHRGRLAERESPCTTNKGTGRRGLAL